MKSHFQTLLGQENWFIRGGQQEIQGLRCLDNSITQNTPWMFYIVEEHMYLLADFGLAIQFGV